MHSVYIYVCKLKEGCAQLSLSSPVPRVRFVSIVQVWRCRVVDPPRGVCGVLLCFALTVLTGLGLFSPRLGQRSPTFYMAALPARCAGGKGLRRGCLPALLRA